MVSIPRLYRSLVIVASLAVFAVIGWQYSVTDFIAGVRWSDQHWPVVVLGLGGLYLVRPFFLWPLSVFSVFIGYVFGFPSGLPVVLGGTVLTCLPPFLIAARFDGDFGYVGWVADQGAALVETTGQLRGMIAARLSPAPADAVSYGAGIAGVSPAMFAAGTLIGELPWALFYLFLGESLRTFAAVGLEQVDVRLLLLAGVISVVLVARPLYEFLRERTGDDPAV